MNRLFRKLQKISGSYYVSLPKPWIKKFGLDKESPIGIEIRNNGSLIISPKLKQEDLKNQLVLNSSRYVAREIVKNTLSGIENIIIISDKEIDKDIRKEIKWFVDSLPNTEIIEDHSQRIVIQNFGYKKIPTKKLIQRLLYLLCDMFENLKEGSIKELEYNFKQLQRFYFILITHIRTYLRTGLYISEDTVFSPIEALDYRLFCEKIEQIGKILRDLQLSEKVKTFFNKIELYYNEVMEAYLKKNLALAYEVWLKKKFLIQEAKSLMNNLDYDDKDKIKEMMLITRYCRDMTALI